MSTPTEPVSDPPPPPPPASPPASASPAPPRRPRRIILLVPLLATAAYVLLYGTVPGFQEYTRETWRAITNDTSLRYGIPVRILRDGERRLLWGGDDEGDHFDITRSRLQPERLAHGLGREHFPALITPQFVAGSEATWLREDARVLGVAIGNEARVYPLLALRHHEVVNDVVAGHPVFAAYCLLADLGAVYDRRRGADTLTFAVSGYTYADPVVWEGRRAFVLWDRDTESLWWPPIGRAVAGPLIDAPLPLLDEDLWFQTTWAEFRARYPGAVVLARFQDFDPPGTWPQLEVEVEGGTATQPADEETKIAPRWRDMLP